MLKKTNSYLLALILLLTISLYAFAATEHSITYDYGVADIRNEYIENSNPDKYTENTVTQLTVPYCDGFEFMGWYLEQDYKTPITAIGENMTQDITLYAKWYEMSYDISYVLTTPGVPVSSSEISNPNVHIRLASEEIFLSEPSYISDIYSFEGWYLDSSYTKKIDIINEYTCSDLTLYAHWVNSEFNIHYDMGEVASGVYPISNPNPDKYTFNSELVLLEASTTDPSYSFEGWYTDEFFSEKLSSLEAGTHGDITLYANWTKKEYSINYVLSDDSGIDPDSITNTNASIRTANVDFVLSAPETSDKSYIFAGWYTASDLNDNSKVTAIKAGVAQNVTLYAKWENAVYKINYDFGNIDTYLCKITNTNPTQYDFGNVITLENAEAEGYIFNGWCTDEALKNRITGITAEMYGDITLYADFTEKTYTINYVVEDKEVTASQVVNTSRTVRTTSEKVYFDDAKTINTDYKFGGWYYDAEFKQEATFIKAYTAENITVYAKWVKIVSYLPVWGDATLSDELSAADARLILRYSAGLESAFSDIQFRLADINNDSKVNAADARLVLRLSAGLEKTDEIKEKYSLGEIALEDGEVVFK